MLTVVSLTYGNPDAIIETELRHPQFSAVACRAVASAKGGHLVRLFEALDQENHRSSVTFLNLIDLSEGVGWSCCALGEYRSKTRRPRGCFHQLRAIRCRAYRSRSHASSVHPILSNFWLDNTDKWLQSANVYAQLIESIQNHSG